MVAHKRHQPLRYGAYRLGVLAELAPGAARTLMPEQMGASVKWGAAPEFLRDIYSLTVPISLLLTRPLLA